MTWEYQQMQIVADNLDATMNAQGLLGWEAYFVSASLVTQEWSVVVYFKRPLHVAPVTP